MRHYEYHYQPLHSIIRDTVNFDMNTREVRGGSVVGPNPSVQARAHKNQAEFTTSTKNSTVQLCIDISLSMFYFQYGSIILPGLQASIGVTRSYSSRPFLCAPGGRDGVSVTERKGLVNNLIYTRLALTYCTPNAGGCYPCSGASLTQGRSLSTTLHY